MGKMFFCKKTGESFFLDQENEPVYITLPHIAVSIKKNATRVSIFFNNKLPALTQIPLN